MLPAFTTAFLIYCLYGWLCYHPALKTQPWVIWAGLLCALATNGLWLYIARRTFEAADLLRYALFWDVSVTVASLAVPLLFFGAKFSGLGWAGLVFIVAGVWMVKYG